MVRVSFTILVGVNDSPLGNPIFIFDASAAGVKRHWLSLGQIELRIGLEALFLESDISVLSSAYTVCF